MEKEDLKIEIVPLSNLRNLIDNPLAGNKDLSGRSIDSNPRKSKDRYEARHMFQLKSGKIVIAFERGSTPLQAKKRLIKLLL